MPGSVEMAPTKTGSEHGEKNSPRGNAVSNLFLKEKGRSLSLAASSAPNFDGGDEGSSADFTPSGDEMAPKNTSDDNGEGNSPRHS